MSSCIVLLSGGLDSSVLLAMVRDMGYENLFALSFDYDQRHKVELEFAKEQARLHGVKEHKIIRIEMNIGASSLTDRNIEVPKDRNLFEEKSQVPSTYVPARNTIFLSFALAWGETIDAGDIFIGAGEVDYLNYPDCRPEYFRAFENMANLSTAKSIESKLNFRIKTPLVNMQKEEIVKEGFRLGVDFSKTLSCYDPGEKGQPCSCCDACRIRQEAFRKANAVDPVHEE
jgi:7-cyano-7-deazaguanine synthase